MNKFFKLIMGVGIMAMSFSCVQQLEPIPQFSKSSSAFSATASATSVAAASADSLNSVLTLNWVDPKYSVGLSKSKFTIRVGLAGNNFTKYVSKDFTGVLTGGLLGKELNIYALKFGGVIGQPIDLDMKVIASQGNNNEPKESAVIPVKVTPTSDLALSSSPQSIITSEASADKLGITLRWNAGFTGYEGTRTYQLEYVKSGTGFTSPTTINQTSLTKVFTHAQLNNIAGLQYGVSAGQVGNVDFRIKATNGTGSIIYSNVVTVAITPYATIYPSIWGMGAALNGWGPTWNNPDYSVEAVGTGFQVYEMIAKLTNGETFRFFAQHDWNPDSYNYPYFTSIDGIFENANDGDKNLRFIGITGWYKVTVNLNNKTVVATSVNEPVLYMMGAALNGWGPSWNESPLTQVKMTYKKPGVFEANPTFKIEAFRFFAQNDWNPTSYNYPYFTGGVDVKFENANDGDKNLKYIGTPGVYNIRVDLNAKTVVNF